jgi:YgiT-type zinc finger domain-containing protein
MSIEECPLCHNNIIQGTTMFSADLGDGVLIVKNVPAHICSVCGNKWFDHDTMLKLETVADNARSRHALVEVISFEAA